ncbi:MAG TPA: DUF58 domain-containing protein [Rhodothermales bacterium]
MQTNRFIDPLTLSRISSLELLARGVVEGFVSGLHRSPYRGFSVEFMAYRPYMPGDDLMHLDWKLFARTDRYFIKEFEDETNTALNVLLDVSASMEFGSGAVTKRAYGSYLAAALAYLAVRQHDAVGLTLFDERVRTSLPPRSTRRHLHFLLRELESAAPGTRSAIEKPLHELAERQRKRGFVALVSDLLDEPESIVDGLRHFRYLGHDVIVFHVIDPQEMTFPFSDLVEFEDMESGDRLTVSAEAARDVYLENLTRHQETIRRECALQGIDYVLLPTDQPLDAALFAYLAGRGGRSRARRVEPRT